MKHLKIYTHFGTIILLSSVISGCAETLFNGEEQAKPYEIRHPISLVESEYSIEVPMVAFGEALSPADKAKIRSFIYGFETKGKDNIVLSIPETGATPTVIRNNTKDIIDVIESSGIAKDRITIGTYNPQASQSGNIKIEFTQVEAKGPDCSDMWSKNLADAYNNTAWKGLGCSTRSNLATVISNPQDLVQMRKMGAGSGARRVAVHDKYILGQVTTASRGAEEKASATDE